MQQERAFGQFVVKGLQVPDLTDEAGAGPTHELSTFQTGLLIQRLPVRPVHSACRSQKASRSHLFHSGSGRGFVQVTRCQLPFLG